VDAGLGDLARHDGYLERQLRRWERQWEQTRTRGEVPALDAVASRLRAQLPAQQRTVRVHGDYRLDNVVFDSARRVEAVLDWELCTLGDPLADVGWLLATWVLPGEDASFMISGTPTRLPGFPPRDELLHRYAQRS
jgi:aminoglycoside phosphotransferase (APT) family kinase protein